MPDYGDLTKVSLHEWKFPDGNVLGWTNSHEMRKKLRAVSMQKTYNKALIEAALKEEAKGTKYSLILNRAPLAAIKAIGDEYIIRRNQRYKDDAAVEAGAIVPAVTSEEIMLTPMEEMQALKWATANLGSSEVEETDAPNPTAWAAYQNMKKDPGIVRDVYKKITDLAKDQAKAEMGKTGEDGRISIKEPVNALAKFKAFRKGEAK